MAAATRLQPPWQMPAKPSAQLPSLNIWNSLTRSKTPFVPQDPNGRKVTWYACGPTVYDDAHLGHARNYVSTDIVRRIMQDYFNFDVRFVMNFTDVDDKIILRGRQQHLLSQYISHHPIVDAEVVDTAHLAYKDYIKDKLPRLNPEIQPAYFRDEAEKSYNAVLRGGALEENEKAGDREAKIKMHIRTVSSAAAMITQAGSDSPEISSHAFYASTQDVLLPYLDDLTGKSITGDEHSIFTRLTKKFEGRFMQDMRDLNVLEPDEITRVTEFMPEIVEYVEKIIHNKFAYATSDGSVYFDVEAFERAGNDYARLEPWNRNDQVLIADGEGSLSKSGKAILKRSRADFALWKASYPGEPSWPSPWGKGRPGWHIECSVMASAKLGRQMDIHSGGIDLAFPHHDNELAQSEAYWHENHTHDQWVNYFIHMGHLSIQGSKMSKSLKNFTTIRQALDRGDWTPRSLRIVFLLGGWREGIEITEDLIKAGNAWEEKLNNFFVNVRDPMAQRRMSSSIDEILMAALKDAQKTVYESLCDSYNTPAAMQAISELITKSNSIDKIGLHGEAIKEVARWVTRMVNIFGLNGTVPPYSSEIGWSGVDVIEAAKPYLHPLSSMRDSLRHLAKAKTEITSEKINEITRKASRTDKNVSDEARPFATLLSDFQGKVSSLAESSKTPTEILDLCDSLRDVEVFDLGVYLEDRDGLPALVRPVTKELVQARELKAEGARKKQLEKEKREKEAADKAAKGKLSHLEMFRTSEYSAWDEHGIPTKDAAGEDLTKSRSKKLVKDWERQRKAHEAWISSLEARH